MPARVRRNKLVLGKNLPKICFFLIFSHNVFSGMWILWEENMKRFLLVVFVSFLVMGNLSANDRSMKSDDTQKRYERKAVMGLGDIGFSQDSVRINMQFCTSGQSGYRCTPWSFNVNYSLGYEEKLKAARTFYDWTITNRFDKIIMGDGKAYMFTRDGEISVPTGERIQYFRSGTGTLNSFQSRLESYLNGTLKDNLGELLDVSVTQRYLELPEREQETFMTTKAKDLGITVDFLKALVNSSYIFAAHVQPIAGSGKVIRKERKTMDGRTVYFYDIEFNIPVNVTFLIYNFNGETKQFTLHKKLVAVSGGVSGSTDSFYVVPTPSQVMAAFNDTFQTAIKAASINANYQLKKDDNFALYMPVMSAKGSKIETEFGVMEDIRVDHPFTVMEMVDGEMKKKGYVRARKVSENCASGYNPPTVMKRTNGLAEEGDLLREYPWTGLFFNLGFGMNSLSISGKDGNDDIGGMFLAPGFHLGGSIDLGYSANSRALSEFYMDLFFHLSFGIDDSATAGRPLWLGGGIGFSKRLYTGTAGFYIAPAVNLVYNAGLTSNDYTLHNFIVNPQLHFGFSVNPSFDIVFKGGWNLGFLLKAEDGDIDVSSNYNMFAMGLTASIDFNFHLPVVGGMARLYKKPSNVCAIKRKSEKKENEVTE
jgi:hypothetical protein